MSENKKPHVMIHEELPEEHVDPLISVLHRIIRVAVKALAILMVFIIIWVALGQCQ